MADDETKVWRFRYHKTLNKSTPDVSFFIVTCHGWSGSHWLATALNTHPDIVCCHSALNVLADTETWTDGKLRNSVDQRQLARQSRGVRSIGELMDEVISLGEGLAYGNVHTLRLRDLPEINEKFPNHRKHYVMNMIRHPVSVVASGSGQLRDMMEWDVHAMLEVYNSLGEQMEFATTLAKKHALNLCSRDVAAFLAACYHQMHLGRDCRIAPDAPTIIMERAVSEKNYFAEVAVQLTGGRIKLDETYLQKVFDIGQVNRHKSGKKKSPSEQFADWMPWQQEAFTYFFNLSELSSYYPKYNYYDLSFISEHL